MQTKILIALLCLVPQLISGQNFSFVCHEIGTFSNKMGQTSLTDIDNDGDLDWVFGRFGDMYWYENKLPNDWELHEMGVGARTDVGGCPHDVNADGWIDYIVGDSWYENTGKPKEEHFVLHKKNMISCHDNVVVDIDGDGILDVVSLSNHKDNPVLCWYKMPEDYKNNWDYHKIGPGIHGGVAPYGYGDLDGDNDIDIVRGNVWFENVDAKGKKWKMHETLTPQNGNRPGKFGLALRTWCYDLDNDGDLDIIQAEADTENGRVFWFENHANASKFEYHLLSKDSTQQDFHSLALADFDLDGDIDICSGGGPLSQDVHKLFIWENKMNESLGWKEEIILEGKRIHELVAADIDGDGDIDICAKPWNGGLHIYVENRIIE